jgi:hypothetical protein
VQRELCDLVNLIAALEQSAGRFAWKIMKAKVCDPEQLRSSGKCSADAFRVVGIDVFALLRLFLNNRPGVGRVFEAAVVPSLLVGCFASRTSPVLILGSLSVHSRRQISAWRRAEAIATSMMSTMGMSARASRWVKKLAQSREFVCCRSACALARLADEPQLAAGIASLLDRFGPYRKVLDRLRGTEHDTNPDQVIDDGGRSRSVCPPCLHVFDQGRRRELEDIRLADRVTRQEFQMTLLTSLRTLEELWDSIAREGDRYESPAWHEQELKATQTRVESGAERSMDWADAKRRLRR